MWSVAASNSSTDALKVSIRPFVPSDSEGCAAIVNATPLWQRHGLSGESAAASMARAVQRDEHVIIADLGGVSGFAWWMPRAAFGRSPYLRLIGVDPVRRSRGIGAALLAEFEAQARPLSRDCFLLVSDFNDGAQRFYEREGYIRVGAIPGFVLPDVAELVYRKVLK
jgi:ribosomal protein S18 acetylase RimI-like enzyme